MKLSIVFVGIGALALAAGCENRSTAGPVQPVPDPVPDPVPVVNLGDPMSGLTADELAAFERGREVFLRRFTPSTGLGPLYNASSCMSCHSEPAPGGGSDLYRNFYVATYGFSPFSFNLPGLISPVVPSFGTILSQQFTLTGGRSTIPTNIGVLPVQSDQRNSIPMFGVGLFERISDQTILANADPDDADADGISGRANNDGVGLGRFGTKAQANNIEIFTRAPLFNQMGVTTNALLGEGAAVSMGHGAFVQGSATPNAPTTDNDGVPDPEMSPSDLGDLIAFSRFLAPPQPMAFSESAVRGQTVFADVGCVKCHIPSLESSTGPVTAYTDLLIHDMGPELAGEVSFGSPQSSALASSTTESEWRTQPLWGVSRVGPYLHDGRASTLDDAIRMHGGEAESIREAYVDLSADQRADLLEFLRHL
ncbi:MAG: di-heme oxidoredictase family protein [Planctomycetota bacterium]